MKKSLRFFARQGWVFGLVTALTIGAMGCGGRPETARLDERAAVTAEVATAAFAEVPGETVATGAVEPVSQVFPGTKLMGRVEQVLVREGDQVTKGQLLARLDSRDLEAAVAQAKAAVMMAEATLTNAEAQFKRISGLHAKGSVTEKNLEDATAHYRITEAGLEQARANQKAAEVMLAYTAIHAPVSGYLTSKRTEAGDMAAPGMPLFTIDDLSQVKVNVKVPESEIGGITAGSPARVSIEATGETVGAVVDRIVPAADPGSRTFEVKLKLDNPGGKMKSGMFARVVFSKGKRQALLVPASAIVHRGQLTGLYVLDQEGKARLRWVREGREENGKREILSGLQPGEKFLTTPPPALQDGTPVQAR